MGCDIHLHVEKRGCDGKWHWVPEVPTPFRDPWAVKQAEKPYSDWSARYYRKRSCECWYGDRNYDAFAILADVRNGRGFAGSVTGEGFEPIALPRGIPEDLSEELKIGVALVEADEDCKNPETAHTDLGDHSQSWVTLEELLAVEWDRGATQHGVVKLSEWSPGEAPEGEYAVRISGGNVRTIDTIGKDAFAAQAQAKALEAAGFDVYVRIAWGESYKEAAGSLYSRLIPALKSLGGEPADVRIVFGFDN